MKERSVIQIEYIPIAEIREYENNPRDNDKAVDAVVRSMRRFGVRSPAIIDKDNVLLAGHTRIKAAIQLGLTEYPCVRADDLTKNQGKAYRLADNRMQEDSLWDTEALATEFAALKQNGFDLTETGFDEFELAGIDMSQADFSTESYDGAEADYDTPAVESGEAPEPDFDTDEDAEDDPDAEFVCIICCKDDAEKDMVADLIGEDGELKRHYTLDEIRERLEAQSSESGADGYAGEYADNPVW